MMRSGAGKTNFISGLKTFISKIPKDCVIAELGSFAGESTELFAQHCKIVYSVDLWGDSCVWGVTTGEKSQDIEKRFDLLLPKYPNIVKLKGRTDTEHEKFRDEELDGAYVDACHTYEAVRKDLEVWLPKIKYNGFIGGHDFNKKEFPGVVQAVTEIFGDQIEVFEDTSWLARVRDEKISVLMPTYNREKYVGEAIESILNQTHKNLELIIWDDGSTDKTVEIVKSFTDKRIRFETEGRNKGISYSRNKLLSLCTSRISCWMDSDDVCSHFRIERQFPLARLGKYLVFTNSDYFTDLETPNITSLPKKRTKEKFVCEKKRKCVGFSCGNSTPCDMFPVDKSVTFFYNNVKNLIGEDCEWVFKMQEKYKPVLLDDILYFHRNHDDRIVKNFMKLTTFYTEKELNAMTYPEMESKLSEREAEYRKKFYVSAYREEDLFVAYEQPTKLLVVTIVSGNFHRFLATMTHKTLKDYAWKCKADFMIMTFPDDQHGKCLWKKFDIKNLLEKYDRVLYVDTDIYITTGAQDLFKMVPDNCIGAFNEAPYCKEWIDHTFTKFLGWLGLPKKEYFKEDLFINAGLFLVSKPQKDIFTMPTESNAFDHDWDVCGEQAYININIQRYKVPVFDIGVPYNAFVTRVFDGKIHGVPFRDCKIFHFAGAFKQDEIDKWSAYAAAQQEVEKLVNTLEPNKSFSFNIKPVDDDPTKISVLMPVYNREKYLGKAIESILSQSYKNIQLFIYNDGSTDRTDEICREYFKKDRRVSYIKGEKNYGIPTARNILLESCASRFACWQDSDDISHSKRIEVLTKFVRDGLMVMPNCSVFNDRTNPNIFEPFGFSPIRTPCFPSLIFPVLRSVSFDLKYVLCGEDDEWLCRMKEQCRFLQIPDILYFYRVHSGRITEFKGQFLKVLCEEDVKGKSFKELEDLYENRREENTNA